MSARQPFVPSRSVSRATHREGASAVTNASEEFISDTSNPLHSGDVIESRKYSDIDKPLNLENFLQKTDNGTAHQSQTPLRHLNNGSAMADLFTNTANNVPISVGMTRAQTPHIFAPTPSHLRSSTPVAALSLDHPVFKIPELPSVFPKAGSAFQVRKKGINAHILTPGESPDLSGPQSRDSSSDGTSQSRIRGSGHVDGLVSMHDQALKVERPGLKGDGPVRIPFDARPRMFGRRRTLEDAAVTGDATNDAAIGISRRKRERSDENDESGDGRVHINKRYKYVSESTGVRDDGQWKTPADSEPVVSPGSPEYPPNYGRQANLDPHDSQHGHHRGSILPLSPPLNQGPRHAEIRTMQHSDQALPSESIWERFLGEEEVSYITEQAEAIEKARKRWEEATYSEWIAGADELAQMFAQILDFAKDHLLSKMKLYATFSEKIDAHNVVLKEQAKYLTQVGENTTGAATMFVAGIH